MRITLKITEITRFEACFPLYIDATDALKKYYPKKDWHNAYYDVRNYFVKNGFEHIQGSGYHSIKAMSESKAMAVIYHMTKEFVWLNFCVRICTISDIPELFNISYIFKERIAV